MALLLVAGCGGGSGLLADGGVTIDAPTDVDPASLPPSCLRALFAACPTDTACVYDAEDGGSSFRECYANGVKVERTGYACSTLTPDGQSTDVMKPDGSLCYHLQRVGNTSMACEVEQFVWSDEHMLVATGTFARGASVNYTLTVTCAVGGESATYDGSPGDQVWFTSCTAGTCP